MPRVKEGVLWMGGLVDYMSEKFLKDAFKSLGEDDVESIQIVKNKFTGETAGYGFIYFDSDASALIAMHKLNGKIIPNSQPPVRFQLNHSSAQASGNNPFSEREFSIWVTDLPDNCDDEILTKTFASRFDSLKTAKVMTDLSHGRKPYGFVRFTNQDEQRDALIHMNGFRGMGDKPIKVSMAIPKNKAGKEDEVGKKGGGGQYSYFYESYWADKAAWTNYAAYQGGLGARNQFIHTARQNADNADNFHAPYNDDWLHDEENEERIIEWDVPVNVDAMNKEFMERSLDAWDGIDKDRWIYSFDTEDSIIPDFDKKTGSKPKRSKEDDLFAMLDKMDPAKIADNVVRDAITDSEITFKKLWKDQTCVIIFLRRLIAVGLEPQGLEEFVLGEFFSGELFVDVDKKAFSNLGFKRLTFLQLFPAIFSKKTREANAKAKSLNLGGDMKGDGYQNGGCMVVGAGGHPLMFSFRQEEPSDHPENQQILEALDKMAADNEEPDPQPTFQELMKSWEEHVQENSFDPSEIFHKMCDILEKETNVYIASDPDPFEERHPSRVDNTCQLGIYLKTFFKRENLVKELFQKYLRETHFMKQGIDKNSFDLNVAACRLVLGIMPGLEISTLQETDGLTNQLYRWVETAQEPLTSFATGILAVVMEQHEFASETEIRDRNSKLVPDLLKKLKELQVLGEEERIKKREELFKRPFALFSKSPQKRRISKDFEETGDKPTDPVQGKSLESSPVNGLSKIDKVEDMNGEILSEKQVNSLNPGWPGRYKSPSYSAIPSRESSNSSWAEMELNIIGHFEIFPISTQTKQIFIIRLLTPLAEYQDFLPMAQESQILTVLKKYINVKETRDARLGFEALRLLGSLFCHKKFTLEWVYSGGLDLLMEMPRPSVAATGSALCIYYLACDSDTMEKICGLPYLTLERLVKYCLWLLECSHSTGRQYAIMFFGLAFPFKVILDIFDAQDGLRKLYNSLSTLKIHGPLDDAGVLDDDELFIQRQMVKSVLNSLKQYFETHLAIRCESEVTLAMEQDGFSPEPPRPTWIPYKLDPNQVTDKIDTMLKLINFRARWPPVDEFIKLGGVELLLQIIVKSYDWIHLGKEETVKPGLDILSVCSILPRVQLTLCENLETPEDKNNGILILLACAEGEVVNDPNVQKAALLVLCHIICAPISRPGSVKHQPEKSATKRRCSDDVINRVWECFRSNNGIMTMLQLIQTKTPVSDADRIRALACQVLVGLARSTTATQIMSKLPIFNNGVLTMLVREPVLPDNIAEHQKFQKYAQELLEKVSGPGSQKSYDNHDITLDMLHRASVVANTKIRFNNKQLYQLIHEHLLLSGLKKTAEMLRKEADFIPLVSENCPAVYSGSMVSSTTPLPARRLLLSPPPRSAITPRQVFTPASRGSIQSRVQNMSQITPQRIPNPSLPIRINRTPRSASTTPFQLRTTPKPYETATGGKQATEPTEQERKVTLTSLVSDYLSNKHAMCKNPMTTCPEFDLFLPHKCPDKRSKREAPTNFAARQVLKRHLPPFGGPGGAKLDRKLLYSRFRPVKVFRASGDERDSNMFTCCAFSGDGLFMMAGTSMGDESTYQIHESSVNHIQPSRDNKLVLTSSSWRQPFSRMWSTGEFFDEKCEYKEEEYVEFSKLIQDKVIGTRADGVATVYDVNTSQQVRLLKPRYSNEYHHNRACFDPTDELILCDGVLWDYRMKREIHKLDKLNQNLSGVFHPSGLEIISNTEVWDIRTFHLQRTVPQLDQCRIVFNTAGDVMFGLQLEQEFDDEPKFDTSFRTFECSDYSSIATIELKKSVLGLCSSWNDLNIAVVEQGSLDLVESVVRLYDVGRVRDLEEDQEDGGDEEEEDQPDFSDMQDDDDDDNDFLNDSIFGSNSNSNSEDGDDIEMDLDEENNEEDNEGDEDVVDEEDEDVEDEDAVEDDGDDSWEDL